MLSSTWGTRPVSTILEPTSPPAASTGKPARSVIAAQAHSLAGKARALATKLDLREDEFYADRLRTAVATLEQIEAAYRASR